MNEEITDLIFNEGGVARIYCWSPYSKYKPSQTLMNYRRISEAEAWESTDNVLMTVNAAFYADKAETLMEWNPEKSTLRTWITNHFNWWYLEWMKKQINYDKNVKKRINGFYDEEINEAEVQQSIEKQKDDMMSEDENEKLNRIFMFVQTRDKAQRFIFLEMTGMAKLQYSADKKRILNFPGRDNISVPGWYKRRKKFIAELKAYCNGNY